MRSAIFAGQHKRADPLGDMDVRPAAELLVDEQGARPKLAVGHAGSSGSILRR